MEQENQELFLEHPLTPDELRIIDKLVEVVTKFASFCDPKLPPYEYQKSFGRRFIQSILRNEGDTVTALWARQTGKTTAVAYYASALAIILPSLAVETGFPFLAKFAEGIRIGIFAPIKQQAELSYGKIRSVLTDERVIALMEEELGVTITSSRAESFELSNGSIIHAKTASPQAKIEGHTYHLIVIDEAQLMDTYKIDKEIEPMRASTNGTMVMIGTTLDNGTRFFSEIQLNIERFKSKKIRNHFEFNYKLVLMEKKATYQRTGNPIHLDYAKYISKQIEKYGVDSITFKLNFGLEWQSSKTNGITADMLTRAFNTRRQMNHPALPRPGVVRVAGLDIGGGEGNDMSCCAVVDVYTESKKLFNQDVGMDGKFTAMKDDELIAYYDCELVALAEFEGWMEDFDEHEPGQYAQIVDFLTEWSASKCVIDATGKGDPVHERFMVLAPEFVWDPFIFSRPSKSNLYKHYINEIQSGRFKIAAEDTSREIPQFRAWWSQHTVLQKTQAGQYVDYSAPESSMKAGWIEKEYHDDYPIATALAVWGARTPLAEPDEGVIQVSNGSSSGMRHTHASRFLRSRRGMHR